MTMVLRLWDLIFYLSAVVEIKSMATKKEIEVLKKIFDLGGLSL